MEILFREHSRLAPLAWAAEITPQQVIVHHGSRVEHGADWLVDGCWPGRFEEGLPEGNIDAYFAFSLRLKKGEVWIDSPAHPLERLCIIRGEGRLIVSPSIAFALALAGLEADPAYPYYLFDFLRVICSMPENVRSMPLADGKSMEIVANRRVIVGENLKMRVEYRPLERLFESFSAYVDYLRSNLAALRDNVASPARKVSGYRLMTSISSGYDSAAIDVLAAPLGWKEAITFARPNDEEDSGAAIGAQLGLNVHPVDRTAYKQMAGMPEVEFLATGTKGEDVVFAEAAPYFKNSLLITGTNGGEVWDRNILGVTSASITRFDASGCALGEFRARLGFLHLPVAHIGGLGMLSLRAISNSAEMAPWSIRDVYDRPIPRRILEEAGIPRGMFAEKKRGMISVTFGAPDDTLAQSMNPESFASLQTYVAENRHRRSRSKQLGAAAKYAAHRVERFLGHRLKRAGVIDLVPKMFDPRHQELPGLSSYLFPWSIAVMKERYAAGLKGTI